MGRQWPFQGRLGQGDRMKLLITDAGAIRRAISAFRPTAVVNCAAFSNVDAAQTAPEEALDVNRDGARHLAAAAAEIGAQIVHISTDYVFDGKKTTPYLPTDQPAPLSLYGISKLAGEVAVREAHPEALILRTSWIFGEGGKGFVAWARLELAHEIRTILGSDREITGVSSETFGAAARRPAYSVLDLTSAEDALGRPLPPWQASLRSYVLDGPGSFL